MPDYYFKVGPQLNEPRLTARAELYTKPAWPALRNDGGFSGVSGGAPNRLQA